MALLWAGLAHPSIAGAEGGRGHLLIPPGTAAESSGPLHAAASPKAARSHQQELHGASFWAAAAPDAALNGQDVGSRDRTDLGLSPGVLNSIFLGLSFFRGKMGILTATSLSETAEMGEQTRRHRAGRLLHLHTQHR